jgi:hypothetical protein
MGRLSGCESMSRPVRSLADLQEWTTILTRAIETFHSELKDHSPQESDLISHQHSFPNLVRVFEKQFRAWREASEERATTFGAEIRCVRLVIGNIRLYDHYARLVVHSFGLQRAVEALPLDLPATFAQVGRGGPCSPFLQLMSVPNGRDQINQRIRGRSREARLYSRLS